MDLTDRVVVVTGAGSGIGAALAARFAHEAPSVLILADVDGERVRSVASRISSDHPGVEIHAHTCDVSVEAEIADLIGSTIARHGSVDLFCGNAGIGTAMGIEAPDEIWARIWSINVMAHVYALRALLPGWLERGDGHLLITASAAGLLTNLGDAPYSVTKHGAVALAEWVAITYGELGVRVSCLCPQGVRTPLLFGGPGDGTLSTEVVKTQRILEPDDVADVTLDALGEDRFLILPHEEVAAYEQARAGDRPRWLAAMQRLQRGLRGT